MNRDMMDIRSENVGLSINYSFWVLDKICKVNNDQGIIKETFQNRIEKNKTLDFTQQKGSSHSR